MTEFNDLWNEVTLWAEGQARHIESRGRLLSDEERSRAARIGVRAPERIRILFVPVVPFPDSPSIKAIVDRVGIRSETSAGMTLGYGIFIRADQKYRNDILPHELRHVAQYECAGSIREFMHFYLKELLHFGYGYGPLEIDAKSWENI